MTDSNELYYEAVERLKELHAEARQRQLLIPDAGTLATADLMGRPSVRTVSVLAIEDMGPLFFIDNRSGKGRQLADNPAAALCFLWPELHYQVVIEGHVVPAEPETSEHHWVHVPRENQLAAWVGQDSTEGVESDDVDSRLTEIRTRFAWQTVPCPPHWQALYLQPETLLFWKLGWRRLHERVRYTRDRSGIWQVERAQPFQGRSDQGPSRP